MRIFTGIIIGFLSALALIAGAMIIYGADGAVSDKEVLAELLKVIDVTHRGSAGGLAAVGVAANSFLMALLKWPRLGALFLRTPKGAKSFVPLLTGGLLGSAFAAATGGVSMLGTGFVQGLLVFGGGQQLLHEAVKHTWFEGKLGLMMERITGSSG